MSSNKNYIQVLTTEPNVKYTLIPSSLPIENIELNELVQSNDVFSKYKINSKITGELIICTNPSLTSKFNKKVVQETYEEYEQIKKTRDGKKDQWILNIIDGISEQEDIIYRDDQFIIIPTYTWDKTSMDQIHVLAIVIDKSLQTIRDLTSDHVELLKKIRTVGLEQIKSTYQVEPESLKMYFHYTPAAFLLHIHFVNTNNNTTDSSVEYSHELSQVIFNLELKSDYYKTINLNKRI